MSILLEYPVARSEPSGAVATSMNFSALPPPQLFTLRTERSSVFASGDTDPFVLTGIEVLSVAAQQRSRRTKR